MADIGRIIRHPARGGLVNLGEGIVLDAVRLSREYPEDTLCFQPHHPLRPKVWVLNGECCPETRGPR